MERRAGRRGMTAAVCMAPRILMFPSCLLYTSINHRDVRIKHVRDAMKLGIGFVSEDRKLEGLFLERDVEFNITIGVLDKFLSAFNLNRQKEDEIAGKYVDMLSIKASSIQQKTLNLSGGNQQKVVLSKWLAISPDILILDEPTRGVDVGAKAEIYALIDQLVQSGVSIIMVSSEMPELINMSDRIYVMCNGEIKACLDKDEMCIRDRSANRGSSHCPEKRSALH